MYRLPDGGDDLGRSSVDGVLVKFDIHQLCLYALDRLSAYGTVLRRLDEALQHQLHRLSQVLNALGHVDEDVGLEDAGYVPRLLLVHPLADQDVSPLQLFHLHGDLAGLDGIHHLELEGLDLDVEAVVVVGGLTLNGTGSFSCDRLPIDDDRRRGGDLDALVSLDSVGNDLQVELAHPGHQVLAGLLVDGDVEGRIFLRDLPQNLHQLRKVPCVLRLDGDGDHGLADVLDVLEGSCVSVGGYSRPYEGVSQARHSRNVPGGDSLHLNSVSAHEYSRLLDPVRLCNARDG